MLLSLKNNNEQLVNKQEMLGLNFIKDSVCLFPVLRQNLVSQRDLKADKNLNNQTLRKD